MQTNVGVVLHVILAGLRLLCNASNFRLILMKMVRILNYNTLRFMYENRNHRYRNVSSILLITFSAQNFILHFSSALLF